MSNFEIILCSIIFGMVMTFLVRVYTDSKISEDWVLAVPTKKGGSYAINYKDKHIANVRGKTKALVLIHAIKGVDITDKLDMEPHKNT